MSKGKYRMSEPEIRSVEMLQSVASDTSGVEIIMLTNESIKVRVQGESHRWYQIDSNFQGMNMNLFEPSQPQQPQWSVSLAAGRWQNDVIDENQYSVSLCLHPKDQSLPIGDRIVSLVLALFNDIKTALQIPMLAQFIICTREMLKEIAIFQDTMIVTREMMDEDDWSYEQMQEEMEVYVSLEQNELEEPTDEMFERQQALEESLERQKEAERQDMEFDIEKKEKEQQELIDFWELMNDKLEDK